ncbi:MAG: Tad domain-containing protein [Gemmataceae bacterium]|nr:Tad domain-containing protein [Gemmataceae bacterium]
MTFRDRLCRAAAEILCGEERTGKRRAPGLHADEDGMITLLAILTVLFLLILIALVGNVSLKVNQKIEVQNTADATAYSAAVWQARGMNGITAANHLLGELMSYAILIDALGPYNGEKNDTSDLAQKLDLAANEAKLAGGVTGTYVYDSIKDRTTNIRSTNTIFEGKKNLIRALTTVYNIKAIAAVLEKIVILPPVSAFGYALEFVAFGVEIYAGVEWVALEGFEVMVAGLASVRKQLIETLMPKFYQSQARAAADGTPALASQAARRIAAENHCEGAVYPQSPALPLGTDPLAKETGVDFGKSQIVRATFPWVNYKRKAFLHLTFWMRLSQTPFLYFHYTNSYTFKTCREYYDNDDSNFLYVLRDPQAKDKDVEGVEKGHEAWTNAPDDVDRMFTVIGVSYRPSSVLLPRFMGKPSSSGIVAYAQAMIYNANIQDVNPGVTKRDGFPVQPRVGWDTLNWSPPPENEPSYAFEWPTWDHRPGTTDIEWKPEPYDNATPLSIRLWQQDMYDDQKHLWTVTKFTAKPPQVTINWQAKLIPVTPNRFKAAAGNLPSRFGGPLSRGGDLTEQFRTH